MPLSCLILSQDSQEIGVLECILSGLHVDPVIEDDLALACIRLKKSKIDAIIGDCDMEGVEKILASLLASSRNDAGPVLIATGSQSLAQLEKLGTEFVARKPVSVEEAVHTLGAARNLILQGRLHYHRQELNTPVSITRTSKPIVADLLNLSQSGVRVRLPQAQSLYGNVGIHFLLPGTKVPIDAQGQVAWADEGGNVGIRLARIDEPMKRDLRLWLERQYFRDPN